jgi:spermidine synthase
MKPFRRLGDATAPDGTVMSLFEHDGDYVIRVNGVDLMSTRRHHSEDALAELACTPIRERAGAQVLIGGLGMGFTLKAALAILGADAKVVVAELVEGVIAWNRNSEYPLGAEALADPRVELVHGDVGTVLRERPGAFDAIMLDVDNGADALTNKDNAQLYQDEGIRTARAALRFGGRLAYWSAGSDRRFERSLERAGFKVTTTLVRAHATSGPRHFIFVGHRPKEVAP